MGKLRKADIDLPEGMDMTDYLKAGGKVEERKSPSNGVSETNVLTGLAIWDTPHSPVEWAIRDLIPMRKKIIAVGDFESGKSFVYLGAALALASGQDEYLGFEIPKQRKVLYIDLENGQDETIRRTKKITVGHNINKHECSKTLTLLTKPGDFSDSFPMIETQCILQKPDVIIIDNLYQLSGASNISDADKIKPLLTNIENLKTHSDAAIVLIHHYNKNTQEQGLTEERMAGSSVINWWYEYCIMLNKTNQDFSMLSVGKSRMGHKNPAVYGIEINDTESGGIIIERGGLIPLDKIPGLLVPEPKRTKWERQLDRMADDFITNEWLNVCMDGMDESVTKQTAHKWLTEMLAVGMVKKLGHGLYKKTNMAFYQIESN